MFRYFCVLLVILLLATNADASIFGSYSRSYSSNDSVIAPVRIKSEGIYNLVVSIRFLNQPYKGKPYETDEYEHFIRRLNVEWSGVVLHQILNAEEQTINDLALLKKKIEEEVAKLTDSLKDDYSLDKDVAVVFSVSNFFLLEPNDN